MAFLTDSFTEGAGSPLLSAHTGEAGATWTKHPNSGSGDLTIPNAIDRAKVGNVGGAIVYYASGAPAGADYTIEAILSVQTVAVGPTGILGRVDTSANTYYALLYDVTNTRWDLIKMVAGTPTSLGTSSQTLSAATPYTAKLEMVGTAIKGYVDGSQIISATDAAITAAGKAGVRSQGSQSNTTGIHFDSISGTDAAGGATHTASASITGAGTVAGTATRTAIAAATLAGAGTIAASGTRKTFATASLFGTGTLTATATRSAIASASLSGTGTVAASATRTALAQAEIQGTGGVNATGGVTRLAAAALSGSGSVAADATRSAVVAAAISGSGTVAASALREAIVAASIGGAGSLSATALATLFAEASIAGEGTIAAEARIVGDEGAYEWFESAISMQPLGMESAINLTR